MTLQQITEIKAIDFHSHFGPYGRMPEGVKPIIATHGNDAFAWPISDYSGTLEHLVKNMDLANISISINSCNYAFYPRGYNDSYKANQILLEQLNESDPGVLMWAVIDPRDPETFAQSADLLQHPKCMGIKIHPEEHLYPIKEEREKIFAFAAEHNAMIITHSGEGNSLPEDFSVFANRYPEVTVLVSHMGCGYDGNMDHHIKAIEMSKHGNLYTDTSSASIITTCFLEYAVNRIGSDHILFGTDSSCYFAPSMRARVDCADIADEDKMNILVRNGLQALSRLKEIYQSL